MTLKNAVSLLFVLAIMACIDDAVAMDFRVENRTEVLLANNGAAFIYATGEIDPDAATRLEALLRENPRLHKTLIILNSRGGILAAGLEMGRVIRKYDLATSIGRYSADLSPASEGVCFSACAYAYLGGRFRYFSEGNSFGVHQFHHENGDLGSVSGTQAAAGEIVDYLAEMEINPRLFSLATRVAGNEMVLFTRNEMLEWNLSNDGALPLVAEYRVEQGYPYLVFEQGFRWGTGKVLFICGRERSGTGVVQTFMLVGPVQAQSILEKAGKDYLELDQRKLEDPALIGTRVQQDSLVTMRGFRSSFLRQLGGADSLGIWYDDKNEIHRHGFEMTLEPARKLISDFSRNCMR